MIRSPYDLLWRLSQSSGFLPSIRRSAPISCEFWPLPPEVSLKCPPFPISSDSRTTSCNALSTFLSFECHFYFGFFPDAFTSHPPPYSVRFIIRTSYCPRVFTTAVTCPYDASYRCPCMWFNAGQNYLYLLRCFNNLSRRSRVLLFLTLTVFVYFCFSIT